MSLTSQRRRSDNFFARRLRRSACRELLNSLSFKSSKNLRNLNYIFALSLRLQNYTFSFIYTSGDYTFSCFLTILGYSIMIFQHILLQKGYFSNVEGHFDFIPQWFILIFMRTLHTLRNVFLLSLLSLNP